jgi:arylsulfatase A-like enzyme
VPKEVASQGVTSHALEMLDEEIPKLFVLLYQTVDSIGHEYGQDSQEVRKEMTLVDGEIARIINVYREAGILDKTLIVITADHGMSSISKKIDIAQVNTAITDAGFRYALLANTKMKPPTDVDLYIMNYGNLQCYFNRPFSADEKYKLFTAIQQVEGIGTIFDEVTLRRMGAHPNAGDFMVGPAEGYWFGGKGGVHGRNWESDGYQTMAGPGIKAGATVSGVKTIDITPTILHMFNVPIPPTVDGHVIHEAVK